MTQEKITRNTFLMSLLAAVGCTYNPRISLLRRNFGELPPSYFEEVLDKGKAMKVKEKNPNNLTVLHLKGDPYEMGFQHGALLKKEVRSNIAHIMSLASIVSNGNMLDEAYERMEPFMPLEEKEEMRGLAHGSGLSIGMVHRFHAIPEVAEYRPNVSFVTLFPESKWLNGSTCTNVIATDSSTADGEMYQLRVLDFPRFLNIQKYSTIMVHEPDEGNASLTIGYAGLIGSLTGMNDQHLGFGEMGYGSPTNETLEGMPFIFLFRKLQREANTLEEAVQIIKNVKRTNSYVYTIGDSKSNKGVILETNSEIVREAYAGEDLHGEVVKHSGRIREKFFPGVKDVVYAGGQREQLIASVAKHYGEMNPQVLMEVANDAASKVNLHNAIFGLKNLDVWVANAPPNSIKEGMGWKGRAATQPYHHFNLKEILNS